MGGDTYTDAFIVGSITEALYGMNEKEEAKDKLPSEFTKVLKKVYK